MSTVFRRDDWVTDVLGNAQAGASVYYLTNQPGATVQTVSLTAVVAVYSDTTGLQAVANPLITDGFGHANTGFPNNAAYLPIASYTVAYVINGVVQQVLNDQLVEGSASVNPNAVVKNPTGVQSISGFALEMPSLILDGAATGSTVILPQAVAAGTLTLPAATDTLVGKATTDIFTNKTFDTAGAGNVLKIGGGLVPAVKGAANQALVMDGFGTNLTFATVGGGGGGATAPFPDNTGLVENSSDNTKLFAVSVGGNTTGVTGTLACAFTTNKTLTLPNATDTLVGKATTDIFTNKSYDTAGTGNALKINGTAVTAVTGTGAVVLASTPTLTSPTVNNAVFSGSSSGTTVLQAAATASGTLTLPAATDTLVGKATTDTFTGKTYDTAGAGNALKINGTAVSAVTGTGAVVLATSATLATPTLTSPVIDTVIGPAGLPVHIHPGAAASQALLVDSAAGAGTNLLLLANNGNLVLEAAGAVFTLSGSSSGQTNIQASAAASGTITVPAATDTLVARATTDTMTNKRVTQRVVSMADATSFTLTADTADENTQANTQATGTLTANAPSGTPTDGQKLIFRIKSTNVQTFSWNAIFRGSTDVALPTTSTGGTKTDYIGFIYNNADSKWDCVALTRGF